MIKLKSLLLKESDGQTDIKNAQNEKIKALEAELQKEFPQLEDLDLHAKFYNVLYIGSIRLKPEFRGKGLGTQIVQRILDFADTNNLTVSLHPSPESEKKKDKERLIKWYSRLGLVKNKGRHADYRISEPFSMTMYRRPKT